MEPAAPPPRSLSLRWRLPLLVSVLIGAVVAALLSAAYLQIESTLLAAAEARARNTAQQLADLLAPQGVTREAEAERLAAGPAVRRLLERPAPDAEEAAALEMREAATTGVHRLQLWTRSGERVLDLPDPEGADTLLPVGEAPVAAGGGPLERSGDLLYTDVVAEVAGASGEPIGWLVVRRLINTGSTSDSEALAGLLGGGATLAIGGGDVWTDLATIVPSPLAPTPDEEPRVGALVEVQGMPWSVWVGFPRSEVVAPAVEFMGQMGVFALLFLITAVVLTAYLTGRITRPLTALTTAAERLSHGEAATVETDRGDEIGRLSGAFNRMVGHVGAAQDRLEARARELEASEARKAAILDSAMDAIITVDHAGRMVEINRAGERIFGRARGELVGAPLAETLIAPADRDRVAQSLADGPPSVDETSSGSRMEVQAVHADGGAFPVEMSLTRIPRSDPPSFTTVIRDLTEQRRREAALHRSEARVARISESGLAGIVVQDLNGRVLEANDAFLHMVGYSREELLSGAVRRSDLTPPEWTRADREAIALLESNGSVPPYEKEYLRKDGTRLPILLGAAMLDERSFVAIALDITQRKDLESERARGVRLESENRRIEEANRLKSEFLANMSHELRTPLNAIIGFTELLHDGAVTPDMPEFQDFLGDILSSGKHLLQLINDVLDLSKVEAGRLEFRPEPVELERLVGEVLGVLRTAAANGGITVHREIAPEVRSLTIDAARLKQVLYNYLSNAIKFTPAGGRVTIRALPDGEDRVRLEVEDTGVGIADADIAKLFVEFQQLDAGAAKAHAGTGLGLALTRRLVEAQGGAVGCSSREGDGSKFWAVLPRHARRGAPIPSARSFPGQRPGAPTILVVEDDVREQEALVGLLRREGYAVEVASTVAQAQALSRGRRFDAVILDLILPDGSGLDVLRSLRRDDDTRPVPVLVVTVVAEPGAVAGFAVHDLLSKPLDEATLLASLRRAGVSPDREGEVVVVDDDLSSIKLMARALTDAGYDVRRCEHPAEGLEAAAAEPPLAVVLDLMMPEMTGFEFLDRFRQIRGCETVPVLVWTVKDLAADEYARLTASAQGIFQKGRGAAAVVDEVRTFLEDARAPAAEREG